MKASCCGRDTVSSYVTGVHFTVEVLIIFGVNKKVKGRQLWAMRLIVMGSIKKALLVVTKLSLSIYIINKNCAVISYASGKNQSTLMQYIDNGMNALALSEGADSIPVDEVCSDNDNEVLGAVSVDGMPIVVDKDALNAGEDDVDKSILETVENTKEANNGKLVNKNFNDDDNVEGLVEASDPLSDPFGGVIAPQGYVYMGKLAFTCFGPTSKYFTGMLAMGGRRIEWYRRRRMDQGRRNVRLTQSVPTVTERGELIGVCHCS